MTPSSSHEERQRRFYDTRAHTHLRPGTDDPYSEKLAARLAMALGLQRHHRVLELGASFGRFTFPLLRHCGSVVAVDISERVLAELASTRDTLGIPEARCRVQVANAESLTPEVVGGTVDFVVGFFILHHLPDLNRVVRTAADLLEPGGGMAFVEPNRRNPLFLAQILACPDMSWSEEKGTFRLSAARVQRAYRAAGLLADSATRFGFFPPQLVNRFPTVRRLEARLEAWRLLDPLLPFLLLPARRPQRP